MANNKVENVTIPLASKLNMNQNQALISSSYDMFNDVNSPIYGGNLSPLYIRQCNVGSPCIYDKHGNKWHYDSGTVFKNGEAVLTGGDYYFGQTELKEFPYNIDQMIVTNKTADSNNNFIWTIVFGYMSGDSLYVGAATVWEDGSFNIIREPSLVSSSVVNFRIIKNWNSTKHALVVVRDNTSDNCYDILVRLFEGTGLPETATSWPFTLAKYTEATTRFTVASWTLGSTSTNRGSSQAGESLQIIVSAPFNVDYWANTTSATAPTVKCRGITILNKRQIGENAHKHLAWSNCLFSTDDENIRVTNLGVQAGPLAFCYNIAGNNSAEVEWNTSEETRTFTGQTLAIFCDDSTIVYQASTFHDSRFPLGSTDDNFWATMADFGEDGAVYSDPYTNNQFMLYLKTPEISSTSANNLIVFSNETDDGEWGTNKVGLLRYNIIPTLVTNQRHHRFVLSGTTNYQPRIQGTWNSWMIDNLTGFQALYYPGTTSTMTLPNSTETGVDDWASTDSDKESIWYRRDEIDAGVTNNQGSYAEISNTHWRVLFNYKEGYVSGISYFNKDNEIGTLVTQWDQLSDTFYIDGEIDYVYYKNTRTQNVTFVTKHTNPTNSISIYEDGILKIVADRYLIWNTNAYWNCWDIELNKAGHWASDWNNRIFNGVKLDIGVYTMANEWSHRARANYSDTSKSWTKALWNNVARAYTQLYGFRQFNNTATIASGFDLAYAQQKSFSPSKFEAYQAYQKVWYGNEQAYAISTPTYSVGNNRYTPAKLDYYYSSGVSSPVYKNSFTSSTSYKQTNRTEYPVINGIYFDGQLEGVSYPITSKGSAYYNFPIVGIEFISSYSGKYGVKVGQSGYSLIYDGIRPIGLYNTTSMISELESFFIIQSQYYGIVNDYICAISYNSSNVLTGIEQIVNINGMKFIGAFPACAYFYSASNHAIYAFTGDADLKLFVQTDKIDEIKWHLYAPNNEWIYLGTNNGIYVLTQNNVFRIPYYTFGETWRMFETDDNYNIIEDVNGNSWEIRLGYDAYSNNNEVYIETTFFGPGDMKQDIIDCWYIKFFKPDPWKENSNTVTVQVNTITDRLNKGETVSLNIDQFMWDDNNNYLFRYQPSKQMAQGAQLVIKSPYPISYIGFSKQGDNTTTTEVINTLTKSTGINL